MSLSEAHGSGVILLTQSELVALSRSSIYYQAKGESTENLCLMRLLDEQYLKTPFYGYRRMSVWLRVQGHRINPKPDLSKANTAYKTYPYLIKKTVLMATAIWYAPANLSKAIQPRTKKWRRWQNSIPGKAETP